MGYINYNVGVLDCGPLHRVTSVSTGQHRGQLDSSEALEAGRGEHHCSKLCKLTCHSENLHDGHTLYYFLMYLSNVVRLSWGLPRRFRSAGMVYLCCCEGQ